ncbi:MAG: hypothetical protein RLY86_1324 [Pseudomonadota bacterium]|jgi:GT2 family glycosyltransferase
MTDAAPPRVSVVVTPREKFSLALDSLDSLLPSLAGMDHELIYVDGNSPRPVREGLAERARHHPMRILRSERYLAPNAARNRGAAAARAPLIVFIDNDVMVTPGWLEALVVCAERTGAAIVGPLVCQGAPLHSIVHCAGGECGIRTITTEAGEERHIYEHIAKQGRPAAAIPREARRTELAEFHCMLVRADFLKEVGGLDEGLLSSREHVDICLQAKAMDAPVWLEPASVVTYVHDSRLRASDLAYYMLRWSDDWERRSLLHLVEKHDLSTRGMLAGRFRSLGWRRRAYVLDPFVDRMPLGGEASLARRAARRVAAALDRRANRVLTRLAGDGRGPVTVAVGGGAAGDAR